MSATVSQKDIVMLDETGECVPMATGPSGFVPSDALALAEWLYWNAESVSYAHIRSRCKSMASIWTSKALAQAAKDFGAHPLKPTKLAIVASILSKIERRKSTLVRCSF